MANVTITPTETNVLTMLENFLSSVLPAGTAVVTAQQNRVAAPVVPDYVIMTPIRFTRLRTNVDAETDTRCVASIAGTILTVSAVTIGSLSVSNTLEGTGVIVGTTIVNTSNLPNAFVVTPAQNVPSQVMSAGSGTYQQAAEITVQLDFHSANLTDSADMAQVVSTLFRDEFAVDQFLGQSPSYDVTPFYADDPKQIPFINENQQYEWRWVVDAMLQVNQTVAVPAPYADSVQVELFQID